jgi:hypothetical protein
MASAAAQTAGPQTQLVLENEFVRVSRITIPPKGEFKVAESNDAVVVRLQGESAQFVPKGEPVTETNATDRDEVELLVELKKHWDVEMRPCSFPKTCTRETKMGQEPIAWTTTLFTNGFMTATMHKVVRGGTLTSSYYTAKGSDKIVLIPFTDVDVNFSGTEENLKPGQAYFGVGTEVEVTAGHAESRWFVLRFSGAGK